MKRIAAIAVIVLFVVGCGDGESDEEAAGGSGTSGGSGAGSSGGSGSVVTLSISGSPPSQTLADTPFSFTPTVSNPDSVSVTFSATSLPGWASINSSTGEISGTPGAGDVGTYTGISVTVSGGGISATSSAYSIEVVAVANGSATLSWVPPTENTDGSPLTDLTGYKIYWGQSASSLDNSVTIDNAGITTYLVEQLTPATWYFAATAFDADGLESALSNVASKTIT